MKTVLNDTYPYLPSANRSSRDGHEPAIIVDHYTGGPFSARGQADWMLKSEAGVSYHFLVGREGDVYQLVPLDEKAWHAGISSYRHPETGETEGWLNLWSIGIGYANAGLLARDGNDDFWVPIGGDVVPYEGPEPVCGTLKYDDGREVHGCWEPYPGAQIEAGLELHKALVSEGWPSQHVGHEECAMPFGRKSDPGPAFPWVRFGRLHATRRTWPEVAP